MQEQITANFAGGSAYSIPDFTPGSVWLVGAGPGDPGLLTLHAVEALRRADYVVYDALVNSAVLDFARPEAVREFAGKRGGRPSHNQADITARLVELAQSGARVVRLKGGDPFVFGRGAEEALALAAAGVAIRIIPGLTAGLSAPALAGMPATMRTANQAFLLVTGHPASPEEDRLDWEAAARLNQPIAIYMGLTHLERIVTRLLAGGRAPETPCAVIREASLPSQSVLTAPLVDLPAAVTAAGVVSPVIILIDAPLAVRAALAPVLIP